jgi:hypothetical protein
MVLRQQGTAMLQSIASPTTKHHSLYDKVRSVYTSSYGQPRFACVAPANRKTPEIANAEQIIAIANRGHSISQGHVNGSRCNLQFDF